MAQARLSLRAILAAAFGGIALLAALGTSLLAGEAAGRRLQQRIADSLEAAAGRLADRLDREMAERWRDVQVMAALPPMTDSATPAGQRRAMLRRLHDSYRLYALLAFIGPDGRVVADSRRLLEGTDASARPFIVAARSGPVVADVHDAQMLAGRLGRADETLRLVDLAAPVRDAEGALVGIVAAHLDWRWAADLVGSRAPGEPEILLLSAARDVLLGPPELLGRTLPHRAPGLLVAERPTAGHGDYPGLGWIVQARLPVAQAEAPLAALRRDIFRLGLGAAAVAAAIGWLVAAWIAAPLRRLAAGAVQRLAPSPAPTAWPAIAGYAEAESLSAAFTALLGQREAQAAARQDSEQRLRLAQWAGQVGTYDCDIRHDRVRVTRFYAELHGLPEPPEEATWTDAFGNFLDAIDPRDRDNVAAVMAVATANPGPYAMEYRLNLPDGRLRWIADRGEVLADASGCAVRLIGAIRDITSHRAAEEALRDSEARLRLAQDAAGIGAWELDLTDRRSAEQALCRDKAALEAAVAARTAEIAAQEAELRRIYDRTPAPFHSVDADGRIRRVSAAWLDLLGYTEAEVLGRRTDDFMPPDSAARWEAALAALQGAGDATQEVEYRMRRADGQELDVLLRARAEFDEAGQLRRSYAVLFDLTARNAAKAQLREAQKLDALGRIAGGVAHDFNNLLQVIGGALRLVQTRPEEPERVRRYAGLALEAAERGAGVTRRMLAFARRDQLQSGPVDVAVVFQGLRTLLQAPLGPNIVLDTVVPPGLPPVRADRMQLDLVLFNLALNARDAMPQGGRLRLAAAPATPPPGLAPGGYVRIDLADTGAGMDAATLARATEPYFTTKGVGQGTGLGVAMAHGFAVQSGGRLAIDSRLGAGTTVTLWLPETEAEVAAVPSDPPRRPTRRPLSVLMVEDEPELRAVLASALREEGMEVTEAPQAEMALATLARCGPFDAMVADHAMPGMTGAALAEAVAQRWPGLPVVILTGNAELPPGGARGATLLTKPVDPAALADRLLALAQDGTAVA